MNCHEAIDHIGDALEGSLAAHVRAGFEDHMQECAACRTYLEQLRLTRRVLRHLPLQRETSRRRPELIARFKGAFPKSR